MSHEHRRIAGYGALLALVVIFVSSDGAGAGREHVRATATVPEPQHIQAALSRGVSETVARVLDDPVAQKAQAVQISKEEGKVGRNTGYNGLLVLWLGVVALLALGYYYSEFDPHKKAQFPNTKNKDA